MRIEQTNAFERAMKKIAKKHFPISVLKPCIRAIVNRDTEILRRIKDHSLSGRWRGYREFHPARFGSYGSAYDNWFVIYRTDDERLVLLMVATGSHKVLDQ